MKKTLTRFLALVISLTLLEWTSSVALARLMLPPSIVSGPVTEAWAVHYSSTGVSTSDRAVAVAVDGEGNVIITGNVYRSPGRFNPNFDIVTIKYSPSGQPIWTTRHQSSGNYDERATKLVVDAAGNVFVTGSYASMSSGDGYLTLKYDASTGQPLWVVRYPRGAPADLALDAVGNVFVTGSYYSGAIENTNFATVKYDGTTGQQLWERHYNGPESKGDNAVALAVDGSNNVVVTGSARTESGQSDYMTLKYDGATGQQLWATSYNSPANKQYQPVALALDALGDVFVTGITAVDQSSDIVTVKYEAATGRQQWAVRYDGPAQRSDQATALAVDGAGNVVVAGFSNDVLQRFGQNTSSHSYATVLKYTTNGEPLWVGRYARYNSSSTMHFADRAEAMTLDAAGNVYIVGTSVTNFETYSTDYRTVKFDATTGEPLWNASYDGPSPSLYADEAANSIAVDRAGNVLVVGSTLTPNQGYDITTVKYAQTPNVPLPVELVSFDAITRGPDVLLRWATAQERNNKHFEVEVSTDGLLFQRLHLTPGQGTSTQPHTYQYLDRNAPRYGQAVVYYRLKQVDLDGSLTYSSVQAVSLDYSHTLTLQAWPNPLGEQLQVQISSPQAGEATLCLTNTLGQVVLQERTFLEIGSNTLVLPMNRVWPAGIYGLQLRQGTAQRMLKLIQD